MDLHVAVAVAGRVEKPELDNCDEKYDGVSLHPHINVSDLVVRIGKRK